MSELLILDLFLLNTEVQLDIYKNTLTVNKVTKIDHGIQITGNVANDQFDSVHIIID